MTPIEQLTYRGQVRRIRPIAVQALTAQKIQPIDLRLIFHGENTTFRAWSASGDQYLVRVHRPGYQNASTIRSELELLAALRAQTDLIVPHDVGGVQTFGAPGVAPRNVVVFHWRHGRMSRNFGPTAMRRLGRVAATLHEFAGTFDTSEQFDRKFLSVDSLVSETMGASLDLWPDATRPLIEEVVERVEESASKLGQSPDVWGIIHADLHHGNRLIVSSTDGPRLALIDFDDAGFGYYLMDIAVMLGWPRNRLQDQYDGILRAFLRGYRSLRPLDDDHVQLLPHFFALRAISIALWVLFRSRDNPYFKQRAVGEVDRTIDYIVRLGLI